MYFSYTYKCDTCGDERDLATNADDGGRCHSCDTGRYYRCGEAYDQEYIDQQKYEQQQDREYEERHRHDRY
jgi:DNA-directed RNA polymerase subunit RPC12/RpoP